ncbi:DUF3177 family protein [Cyanobium sp. Morenito 9A2]|uniref:DUF3177 family protein n=1 Tax=Cyanobium sp. Morenito 9A2 TaxID=2823718 RepID=UPI0020CD2D79|nr:DUF3177 family protein [Cyanobium sp. Morenito 9A2]MCP9849664.1 DUF3177 family protein [Cyanobium sp. Morenito 9A2]
MPDLLYRTLVWLDYRLAVVFAVGLPLVLLIWAVVRREGAMQRLLTIYWKVASLLVVTVLLMTDGKPLGYLLGVVAQLLIISSLWFWVDINEELADLPPWRPLPFTVRAWRWGLTVFASIGAGFSATALGCAWGPVSRPACQVWLEAPKGLNVGLTRVFDFVFGADWTPPFAAFVGYLGLVAYVVGLLQWLLVRLPKQGRVAGEF